MDTADKMDLIDCEHTHIMNEKNHHKYKLAIGASPTTSLIKEISAVKLYEMYMDYLYPSPT